MFRRKVQTLDDILNKALRQQSLEAPLLQKRLVDAWEQVVPKFVVNYTENKFIRNQTLWVKILNPALRQDLSMQKTELVRKLNAAVGSQVIVDLHLY